MKRYWSIYFAFSSVLITSNITATSFRYTREFIYPSAYTDPQIQVSQGVFGGGNGVAVTGPSPSAFSTREIGVLLDVQANVGPAGREGSVSNTSAYGNTELMLSAAKGDLPRVKQLLALGAEANSKNQFSSTALMGSSAVGNVEICSLLIEKGADVNARGKTNQTALMFAAKNGHSAIVQLLLQKGAELNVQDQDGLTPIMYAIAGGHTEIVQEMISKGANLTLKDKSGATALVNAKTTGNQQIIILLTKSASTP
jgi:hypothetical protein